MSLARSHISFREYNNVVNTSSITDVSHLQALKVPGYEKYGCTMILCL